MHDFRTKNIIAYFFVKGGLSSSASPSSSQIPSGDSKTDGEHDKIDLSKNVFLSGQIDGFNGKTKQLIYLT